MDLSRLTPTARRIADLAAQGISMREIAEAMQWTEGSVKAYLSTRVYRRLGVKSQMDLMRGRLAHVESLLRQAIETNSQSL